MTEYKTFDDYVKNTFNIEPRELTHISPEEQKKKTVVITVDELINIWNELTELKAGSPKWHKVADGDLPEDDIKLAIIEIDDCGYLLCNYRNGFWYDANSGATCAEWITNNIIAWKEIVLPKEIENA